MNRTSNDKQNVPIERFHFFEGKPQCAIVEDRSVPDKHLHKETEIAYVLKGVLRVRVEESTYQVEEGEMLCICENVLHQYLQWDETTHIVKIKYMKEWLMPSFFDQSEKEECRQLHKQVFRTHADERIARIVQDMLSYSSGRYVEYRYLSRLIELNALLLQQRELICEMRTIHSENTRYMEETTRYLQENCFQEITLQMMAEHIGLTESYCSKYIKKNTGISFVQYLNAIRINNAQRLLMYTDYNITEIAERSGFSSVQTFNRVFKQQTNRTPREYRNLKRN